MLNSETKLSQLSLR